MPGPVGGRSLPTLQLGELRAEPLAAREGETPHLASPRSRRAWHSPTDRAGKGLSTPSPAGSGAAHKDGDTQPMALQMCRSLLKADPAPSAAGTQHQCRRAPVEEDPTQRAGCRMRPWGAAAPGGLRLRAGDPTGWVLKGPRVLGWGQSHCRARRALEREHGASCNLAKERSKPREERCRWGEGEHEGFQGASKEPSRSTDNRGGISAGT